MAKDKLVYLKSREDVALMRKSADVLGRVHAEVAKAIQPGVKTKDLDKIAFDFIKDHGGVPSFLNYSGFPASLCISVNDVVVHGIPSNRVLLNGDIVSIDCGVKLNGFHSDSAFTYPVGEISDSVRSLLKITKQSLELGIKQAVIGNRTGDIGFAVQNYTESFKYGVVRELVGHGVGKFLHEAPEVPNYGKRGTGHKLVEGMTIAIEPMINQGTKDVFQENDGWTIRTKDRLPSAHYEHTVLITKGGPEILTTFEYIEKIVSI